MPSHRVSPGDPLKGCVAPRAKIVDRFIELESIVGGMGIMAGDATDTV